MKRTRETKSLNQWGEIQKADIWNDIEIYKTYLYGKNNREVWVNNGYKKRKWEIMTKEGWCLREIASTR